MRKIILAVILLNSFLALPAIAQSKLMHSKYAFCSEVTQALLIGYFRNERICFQEIDLESSFTRLAHSEYSVSLMSNESKKLQIVLISESKSGKFTQLFLNADKKLNKNTDWILVKKYQKQIDTVLDAYRKF